MSRMFEGHLVGNVAVLLKVKKTSLARCYGCSVVVVCVQTYWARLSFQISIQVSMSWFWYSLYKSIQEYRVTYFFFNASLVESQKVTTFFYFARRSHFLG